MNDSCVDPGLGRLLVEYECGLLSPGEAFRFEVHLLDCDACFRDLVQDTAVAAVLAHRLAARGGDPHSPAAAPVPGARS